jgi:Bardet-Biedl syndrome 9 protein
MSLFKAREWWSTKCGSSADEEFVKGALAVGNVDNEKNGNNKVVTGSLSGYLRIYYPRTADYKIEDLMLEQQLGEPILQVAIVSSKGCLFNTINNNDPDFQLQ